MKLILGLFSLFVLFSPLSAQENGASSDIPKLKFYTHSLAFGVYEDEDFNLRGRKGGGRRAADIEIVRALMKKMGGLQPIKSIPLKEGLILAQLEENIVFFNVVKRTERENLYKWVGPLQTLSAFFYGPNEKVSQINTLEDAKQFDKICIETGRLRVDIYKANGFENLLELSDKFICMNMLKEGRVDLYAMTDADEKFFDDFKTNKNFSRSNFQAKGVGYLAFSKNVSDDIIREWQSTLDDLKASGEFDRIIKEYR